MRLGLILVLSLAPLPALAAPDPALSARAVPQTVQAPSEARTQARIETPDTVGDKARAEDTARAETAARAKERAKERRAATRAKAEAVRKAREEAAAKAKEQAAAREAERQRVARQKAVEKRNRLWDERMRQTLGAICVGC